MRRGAPPRNPPSPSTRPPATRPLTPPSPGRRIAVVPRVAVPLLSLAILTIVGWLGGAILVPRVAAGDTHATAALVSQNHAVLMAMTGVSWLGSGVCILIVGCMLSLLLVRAARLADVAFIAMSALGATVLSTLVKNAVQRPRPSVAQVAASGWSFPSGHATESMAFYGALVIVAISATTNARRRLLTILAAGTLVVAIAYSRLALGVHYPSDVVAGLVLGALWLAISAAATGALTGRGGRRRHGRQVGAVEIGNPARGAGVEATAGAGIPATATRPPAQT